jgi:pantetheine-phosphate adenylyltransferase
VPEADAPLRFSRVALGGTFDRLHCGHELLLGTAALVTTQKAYVGITGRKGIATQTQGSSCACLASILADHNPHCTELRAADLLLASKNHRELLQPYDQRRRAAVKYMQAVRPGLQVEAGPLSDPKVWNTHGVLLAGQSVTTDGLVRAAKRLCCHGSHLVRGRPL